MDGRPSQFVLSRVCSLTLFSLPTIEDPNTGIKIWESGAIVQYLVDTYDKDHKISFASAAERAQEVQWLHFQVRGACLERPRPPLPSALFLPLKNGHPMHRSRVVLAIPTVPLTVTLDEWPRSLLWTNDLVQALPPREATQRDRTIR